MGFRAIENSLSSPRSIFCLKKKADMKEVEEREDCFIHDFDPYYDSLHPSKLPVSKHLDDLSIIAEKGQVACRDFPHSRHLCVKYPFKNTPHKSYCKLCYCYVCDVAAPCQYWSGQSGHCHAVDNEAWEFHRKVARQFREFRMAVEKRFTRKRKGTTSSKGSKGSRWKGTL